MKKILLGLLVLVVLVSGCVGEKSLEIISEEDIEAQTGKEMTSVEFSCYQRTANELVSDDMEETARFDYTGYEDGVYITTSKYGVEPIISWINIFRYSAGETANNLVSQFRTRFAEDGKDIEIDNIDADCFIFNVSRHESYKGLTGFPISRTHLVCRKENYIFYLIDDNIYQERILSTAVFVYRKISEELLS